MLGTDAQCTIPTRLSWRSLVLSTKIDAGCSSPLNARSMPVRQRAAWGVSVPAPAVSIAG